MEKLSGFDRYEEVESLAQKVFGSKTSVISALLGDDYEIVPENKIHQPIKGTAEQVINILSTIGGK